MKFLAIETSGPNLGLALFDGARLMAEISRPAVMRQSEQLIPTLDGLLDGQGWKFSDLKALAVSQGPGSFTGLRVGLSFAKGAHLGTGIKVLAIPSLLGWAEALKSVAAGTVVVWLDGRKGLVFRGRFRRDAENWQEECPAALIPLENALQELRGDETLTGDLLETRPADANLAGLAWAPTELRRASAAAIGRLAWPRLDSGEQDDVDSLEPLYLRLSEAEITWQAKASTR